MKKTLTLLTILLLVIFMVGCENSINPIQPINGQQTVENRALGKIMNVPNATYPTIQAAIDAAVDGDEILVSAGTYNETLIIDGTNLSLIADGEVIILPLSKIGHGDAIQVYNGDVSVVGFEIDATNCMGGIYARGGFGGGPASLTATNNYVHSYLKNGITVNGPGGVGDIKGNNVIGAGPLGVPYYAQNGIQFGYGGTGKAMRNEVSGDFYTGPDWGATGILVFESDEVQVQDNTVSECGMGIAVETWGYFESSGSYNKIIKNTITNCNYGVSVAAYSWSPSTMDCFAINNKVANNSVTSTDGIIGIGFYLWDEVSGGYTPTVDNNKLIHNTITGFDEAVYYADGSINDKVHANIYE